MPSVELGNGYSLVTEREEGDRAEVVLMNGSVRGRASVVWDDFLSLSDAASTFRSAAADDATDMTGLMNGLLRLGRSDVSSFPRSLVSSLVRNEGEEVTPYPIHAVPGAAGRLVREGAKALDVDHAFVAVPLLAFAGGLMGRRWCLEVKPGYRVLPTVYAAAIGQPGSGKTPAMDVARAALDRLQGEWWEDYRAERADYEMARAGGATAAPPILRHAFTTDATIEAVAGMLATSPGVVVAMDELSGWVKAMDAYRGGKGGDRQRWLSGWSSNPWKVDRRKGEPIFIKAPVVCVVGGIQPDVLPELAREAGQRDGFIERILWAYPEERYPDDTEATISEGATRRVYELFGKLRPAGFTPDAAPIVVHLSDDARSLLRAWRKSNTAILRATNGLEQGIAAKLPDQAARLALILHALAYPAEPEKAAVAACTMADALDLVEYHRKHAARVLPKFGATGAGGDGSLVAKVARILDGFGGTWVPRSVLLDKLHRNPTADALTDALGRLEEVGRAERQKRGGQPGRPAEEWRSTATGERPPNTTS